MYDVITDRLRVIAYDVKIFRQVKAFDKCVDHERTNRKSEQGKQSGFYIENKNPDAVINASEINNALPMSKLEYFFRIIAMISVPPLEEPMLKRIADPSAGRAMANIIQASVHR